jgi:hypothetical protein
VDSLSSTLKEFFPHLAVLIGLVVVGWQIRRVSLLLSGEWRNLRGDVWSIMRLLGLRVDRRDSERRNHHREGDTMPAAPRSVVRRRDEETGT